MTNKISTTELLSHHKNIRIAKEKDCSGILEIYSPYILNTAISFENTIPSLEKFVDRFRDITISHPWIVFEKNRELLGYAYASAHRSRSAYDWSCEVSVYVKETNQGRGIGFELYGALFRLLKEQGFRNLLAGVTQPNEASNRLHKKLGFQETGTYKNIGYKFAKWHDVKWFQLEINSDDTSKKPIPINRFE